VSVSLTLPVSGQTITAALHSSNYTAIQNAINNDTVPKPTSIASGEVPVWDGAAWVRSTTTRIGATSLGSGTPGATNFLRGDGAWTNAVKTTVGTLAAGPPGSPVTNDIWLATDVDANGTCWQFRYNSAEATYKWEFIGGASMVATNGSTTAFASNTNYQNPSGLSITNARAGDYQVRLNGYLSSTDGSTRNVNIGVGAGAVNPSVPVAAEIITGNLRVISRLDRLTAVAASTAIQPRYQLSFATTLISISSETLEVVPIRII
jgi:hypothetical protein